MAKHALVVDCEKLDYISSAGLRVLLMAAKRLDGEDQGFPCLRTQRAHSISI